MKKLKFTKKDVLRFAVMNVGVFLVALGVYFFKAPNNFATGGVSGLSIILNKFIKVLTQTEILAILNVALLVIGFIFLGKDCTFKTTYCTLMYTAEMKLMEFIPKGLPLTDEVFMEFIYAMLLTGAGSAIIFNCGGSSGGTDIIALIIKKYTKANVGKALVVTDFIIAASAFFVFDIQTGLYSILGLFAKAFLVDGVIESIGKSKYIQIITSLPDDVSEFILTQMHRGYTAYKAVGGYTGEEKTVIITVCKRGEALKLKTRVKAVDPSAFVIITDSSEILGKGFREVL